MEPQLLACPFCGGNPKLFPRYQSGFLVACFVCGSAQTSGETEEGARRRWNTRTPAKEAVK